MMEGKLNQVINDQQISIAAKRAPFKIDIRTTDHENRFFLNGKSVWKDLDGDWIAKPELTEQEQKFFVAFLEGLHNKA